MKYIKPPMLSMNFSENKVGMKKRLKNILENKSKKRGLVTLIITLIVIIAAGIFITVSDFEEAIITRSRPAEISKVQKLISDICSSPATASNPYTYIAEHQTEFDELVSLDKEALIYMFAKFEKGNQIDLEGNIMREACIEILGDEIFSGHITATGQEWYEWQRYFVKKKTADENKIEEFKTNYPKLSVMIEVIDKYERTPINQQRNKDLDIEKPDKGSISIILDKVENGWNVHDVNLQQVQYALNDIGISEIYLNDIKIDKDTTFICDEDEFGTVYVDGIKLTAPFKFEIFDGDSTLFQNDVIKNMINELDKYSIQVTLKEE